MVMIHRAVFAVKGSMNLHETRGLSVLDVPNGTMIPADQEILHIVISVWIDIHKVQALFMNMPNVTIGLFDS